MVRKKISRIGREMYREIANYTGFKTRSDRRRRLGRVPGPKYAERGSDYRDDDI
ncbi:hypothetical protein [Phosphitispora sp. TUW77]|uniref:hypothetical protein n=1 Tax=Phosphitispora sp. TUW77 TaxID=3152361 RepID=UPI003AB5984F